ncbi:hypothetical protein NSK_001766 [Nannochloropsis salina CCMP1776]|uniref:Uncharacterized protein n=1 Tax=Nannochloropsis salina CCMP1776 TaxID=1027361 RepID=A0A4D9DD34_9STRA|nr:hypothetical protein NSK_001766 [Nannochloropsis salina CCMP1776]|eukprot:TFJ87435.1 hypothetical protein NSK_001766 [Nannochloropsis salina CCMP1776]
MVAMVSRITSSYALATDIQDPLVPSDFTQTSCSRSSKAANIMDCTYEGHLIHVTTVDAHTNVEALGSKIWSDLSTGEMEVEAPGFKLRCLISRGEKDFDDQPCEVDTSWRRKLDADYSVEASEVPASMASPSLPEHPSFAVSLLRGARTLEASTDLAGPQPATQPFDCRRTAAGRNCTNAGGQWAHVERNEDGGTHVTAPGVDIRTGGEGGGDVRVDAWGFHLVCRKEGATNKTTCGASNDWFGKGGAGRTGDGPAPVSAARPRGPEEDVPDPVMHLAPQHRADRPAGSSGNQGRGSEVGSRGMASGSSTTITDGPFDRFQPASPAGTVGERLTTTLGQKVSKSGTVASKILSKEIESASAPATILVGVVEDPPPHRPSLAPKSPLHGSTAPSTPDPRDPLWVSNPKNCTRAFKGEGKDCWDDEHWVNGRTGTSGRREGPGGESGVEVTSAGRADLPVSAGVEKEDSDATDAGRR